MGDYGLKISRSGSDVKTTPLKDLAFLSEDGALKIYTKGTAQLTTDGSGDGEVQVSHNLNYPPAFFVYRKDTAEWDLLSGSTQYANAFFPVGAPNFYVKDDTLHHAIHAYCDETKLYIRVKGGKPSTTMNFVYLFLVDQSKVYGDAANISLTNDFGFAVSKPGYNVLTAKEYQKAFSSKYKILQFYSVNKKFEFMHFDPIFASPVDTFVEQASYIDFEHGLGYAPMFIAHAFAPEGTGGKLVKTPYSSNNSIDAFNTSIAGFADATRVRIYWWRSSTYTFTLLDPRGEDDVDIRINILSEKLNF